VERTCKWESSKNKENERKGKTTGEKGGKYEEEEEEEE
jgi:hypothetical protein